MNDHQENEIDNRFESELSGSKVESEANKLGKRKYLFVGLAIVVALSCICLLAIGNFNLDFYAGGYSIEKVVITDEIEVDEEPSNWNSKTVFDPTSTITTSILTSGIDGRVGMRWFHEDQLLFEFFERTIDNRIGSFLKGTLRQPLPSGDYRVEIYVGGTDIPDQIHRFTVSELALEVIPPYPTPSGHLDLEQSVRLEIPFAFDEVWQIEGQDWQINETKIVFLDNGELFVVLAEIDEDPRAMSEEQLQTLTRPVAQYAIENGYLEQARQIQINGKRYQLTDTFYITLIDPQNPGQGYRVPFELIDFKSQ